MHNAAPISPRLVKFSVKAERTASNPGSTVPRMGTEGPVTRTGPLCPSDQGVNLVGRHEDGQELVIALIGESLRRRRQGNPAQLVDLSIEGEGPRHGRHHPVGHCLGPALAVDVLGVPDEAEEPARHPGLLVDLPQRRLFGSLARFEFPLGERPVLVLGPVHDGDLEFTGVSPDDQSAGGLYDIGWSR